MTQKNKNIVFFNKDKGTFFLFGRKKGAALEMKLSQSADGVKFKASEKEVVFKKSAKTKENLAKAQNFNIGKSGEKHFLNYEKSVGKDKKIKVYGAFSEDLHEWQGIKILRGIDNSGVFVSDFFYDNDRVMYLEHEGGIAAAYSEDLLKWRLENKKVIEPRKDNFDNNKIIPANVFVKNREIILFYYHIDKKGIYSLGFAILDYDNPEKVICRCEEALWSQEDKRYFSPIDIVEIEGRFALYWEKKNSNIFLVLLPPIRHYNEDLLPVAARFKISLERHEHNPIISPRADKQWEALAAFNPTVFELDGKVHILYRAMGHDAISSVGYAVSGDGINIEKRYDKPIYVPREKFEGVNGVEFDKNITPRYMSGGGWGGCEDARATVMDGRLYLLYAAFDGYCEPNVAISSIALDDFRKEKWQNWTRPILLTNSLISTKNPAATEWTRADRPSASHTGEKDAALLPEKINGKYVIFHRIWPNIVIDFVDNLDFDGKNFLRGEHMIKVRPQMWDSAKICLAATPVKTDEGWLLIYNAVDKKDSSRYKIGAMLLDLNDPTKVICRSSHPILEPERDYENNGLKYGIVFAGGAIIKNGSLLVYYGGSDEHSCIAKYDAREFLQKLKEDSSPDPVKLIHS